VARRKKKPKKVNAMAYPFRNLVFEGGGVKGIAYVGALAILEERGILPQITRIGGTSAGAINAVLLGVGYTRDEMLQILLDLDFSGFLDDDWGIVRDTARVLREYGWYKGDFFHNWIGSLIEKKVGNAHATFNDLHGRCRDMYFMGTNLSTRFSEVFSFEHTPRMRVADAVRISMSIPLFFTAITSVRGDCYVDGGVLDNYPIKLFDRAKYIDAQALAAHSLRPAYYEAENARFLKDHPESSPYLYNRETLGFRLDSKQEIAVFRDGAEPPAQRIKDFFDYGWALIDTVLDAQSSQHLHSDDWQRTVYIDTLGVSTTDFDLDGETKLKLVESGLTHTKRYFDWYDDPTSTPANRPA
jgi:NTE family protein